MPPAIEGNYEAIEHRAFENYLLELVREVAKEQERLYREAEGEEMPVRIEEVKLAGTYPSTGVQLRRAEGPAVREPWVSHSIWENPVFFDEQRRPRTEPIDMATDILTWARGG